MTFYENLMHLIKEDELTVGELAIKLNLGETTIYKWKNQSPSLENAIKVADYFDVSLDGLCNRNVLPNEYHMEDVVQSNKIWYYKGRLVTPGEQAIEKAALKTMLD